MIYNEVKKALTLVLGVEAFDKVTERNEFFASGVEAAYDSYEIGSGLKTRVDGVLATDILVGDGTLFGDGVVESYS